MRWLYLAIVVVFVAALIIFVFQNTASVSMAFLTFGVTLPLAVLVFIVYVLGALTGGSLYALLRRSVAGSRRASKGVALMRAMVLHRAHERLALEERPEPTPGAGQIRVRVEACGVCRTDLHVVDGELPNPKLPLCRDTRLSAASTPSARAWASSRARAWASPGSATPTGLAPIAGADAKICAMRRCSPATPATAATPPIRSRTRDFVFPLSEDLDPVETAPLLCAGLIGWRSLKLAGDGRTIGIYGFGAAGHIIAQVCRWQGRRVFAFTRPGDAGGQAFARSMGAEWAGGSDEKPPEPLDAAILFAPVGALVPAALAALRKGGRVVCGGIHMSDIPAFPYRLLWEERSIASVANLTRADGHEFLGVAAEAKVRTTTKPYPLDKANEALDDLR